MSQVRVKQQRKRERAAPKKRKQSTIDRYDWREPVSVTAAAAASTASASALLARPNVHEANGYCSSESDSQHSQEKAEESAGREKEHFRSFLLMSHG